MDPFTIASMALAGTEIIRGAVKGGQANRQREAYTKANAAIPTIDPAEIGFMGEVQRRGRAFDAGTDVMTSYNQQQIRGAGAQTQANIVKAGRGNVSDLLRANQSTGQSLAASGAYAAQRGDAMFGMRGAMVKDFAARNFDRKMGEAQMLWQESAQKRMDSNAAIQAGLGMMPTFAVGMGKRIPGRAGTPDPMDTNASKVFAGNNSYKGGVDSSFLSPSSRYSPVAPTPAWWTGNTKPSWYQ